MVSLWKGRPARYAASGWAARNFIPLESSGFSRRNLRLLGLLGGVVVLLGVCAMVLFAVGEQQQTTQVSSSFEESSESSVSEPELPSSLLDE